MTKAAECSDDRRHLILMRHAKSDWGNESLSDHDRPLNRRGRRDAPNMAVWLADQNLVPDVILVSSSTRTRETVALMMEQWDAEPITTFTDELYHASPEEIIRVIGSDGGDARRLMVVAHNPGMTSLVSHFARDYREMATAQIAVYETACESWKQLRLGTSMHLIAQMRPKQLNLGD